MKLYNKHHKDAPPDAVYIGRGSLYGNPFSHMKGTKAEFLVSSRDEAVDEYENYLDENPQLVAQIKANLKGKDLVCFCAPARCHGEILLKIANSS